MKSLNEIKSQLQEHKQALKDEYGVTALGIFGSYVYGEQTEKSDIDILVDLEKPIGLVRLVRLSRDISRLLDIRTDLTTKNALKPHIGERVLREVQYV
ncbi:MAG: nucleotidyltransferase family protein [Nitrospirae bacterium]|nr:nucleotidyltransferase family protein [Nitrospirota bacterium]